MTSRQLIEEQFDQKVNLAMGNALADFNNEFKTNLDIDDLQECDDKGEYKVLSLNQRSLSSSERAELKENLSNYMACYGIDEKYSVDIFNNACPVGEKAYCCSIKTNNKRDETYSLGVSFLSRDDYLFDKMKFMTGSSILIFILLSTVSFVILRALVRQKRITENNIDFFNNTAHELKTPLTNISLALNLLSKKNESIKESRYARIIKCESAKLKDQIERVLYLSRMENGEYALKNDPVNLKIVLAEVIDNMQLRIDEKQGKVHLLLPKSDAIVKGDYYHLSNVFRNLIDNALKYCETSPELTIAMKEEGDQIKISIVDNGIGISKYDQEHIFEKFQRVNTGDIREAKGFGIGLAYVKTVIEMHKGFIRVQSELKKGSQFELILPNQ